MTPINRCLKDKAMDEIDHALGRPLNPQGETYRNFYATSGEHADTLAASPFWQEGRRGRGMRYFAVTDAGREALAKHLREIGDQHRAFLITFDGHSRTVIATSRSKARYSYFLDIAEVLPDIKFTDFCQRTSVRLAS